MRRMDAYEENKRDHLMERGGKFGADVGINRRPLRNIENFVPAVPHSHAMSGTGSHRNPLKEKNTSNRPWTRQIAEPQKSDQKSSLDPIAGKENLTKENSVHDHMPAESTMQIIEEMEEMINADLEEVEMEDAVVDRALDIDKEDADDPLAVADYTKDIYVSYRETEAAAGVRPDYMSDQIDINERMRGILIDWLIEVHYKFDLIEETLFLTVNIIDRFLARETVMRKKLQLVGVTAMLIACKYEEVSPPVVEDLIVISDRAYTRAEVLEMVREFPRPGKLETLRFSDSGAADAQRAGVQHVGAHAVRVHEEIPQGGGFREAAGALVLLRRGALPGGVRNAAVPAVAPRRGGGLHRPVLRQRLQAVDSGQRALQQLLRRPSSGMLQKDGRISSEGGDGEADERSQEVQHLQVWSERMENTGVLRDWFSRVDLNNKGSISAPQLQAALAVGNLNFSISIVQQMLRMHDFDGNGTMNFQEFVALNKFLFQVQNAFSSSSRGQGFLAPDGVYEALKILGFSLDSPSFYTVCESFDQEKKGRFLLDSFISLCIFVQSARNLFNSFDVSRQGRVTLDFNQFVYCAANCRI